MGTCWEKRPLLRLPSVRGRFSASATRALLPVRISSQPWRRRRRFKGRWARKCRCPRQKRKRTRRSQPLAAALRRLRGKGVLATQNLSHAASCRRRGSFQGRRRSRPLPELRRSLSEKRPRTRFLSQSLCHGEQRASSFRGLNPYVEEEASWVCLKAATR